MKFCAKIGIFLLVVVNFCWTMQQTSNGNLHSGKITLGEISLGNYGGSLPVITPGHQENGSYNQWNGHGFYSWDRHGSLTPLDYTVEIPNEHRDKFIPIVNEIGVPVVEEVPIEVPHIVARTMWQPYPVLVPVTKSVPYEVVRYVVKRVEKKVPTPVEKIVPVPVVKPVPVQVERYHPFPVIKRVPIKIPMVKTIVHSSKKGWKKNRH